MLPTLWFRNRWSWQESPRPAISAVGAGNATAEEAELGRWRLAAGHDPAGELPKLLFCDNETNTVRLFGAPSRTE